MTARLIVPVVAVVPTATSSDLSNKVLSTRAPGRVHQLGHGVEIVGESLPSGASKTYACQRLASQEALVDLNVAGLFQLPEVNREIALSGIERGLQRVEVGHFRIREIGDNAQPHPTVNDLVDLVDLKPGHSRSTDLRLPHQGEPRRREADEKAGCDERGPCGTIGR